MRKWTKEWPTEAGYYWYWGYVPGLDIDNDGLHLMFVCRHAGDMFVMAGSMVAFMDGRDQMFKEGDCLGRWMKADAPNAPERT